MSYILQITLSHNLTGFGDHKSLCVDRMLWHMVHTGQSADFCAVTQHNGQEYVVAVRFSSLCVHILQILLCVHMLKMKLDRILIFCSTALVFLVFCITC